MAQPQQTQRLNTKIKAPAPTRKYSHEPHPLPSYLLHSAGGMGFFLLILWIAGFGS